MNRVSRLILIGLGLFLAGVVVGTYRFFPFDELRGLKRLLIGYDHDINTTVYRRHLTQFRYFATHNEYSVVMLGDSITRGAPWCELVDDTDVVNRGITGDTTAGVLQRVPMLGQSVKQVFLMIGINDIKHGVPMDQILTNYQEILHELVSRDYEVVVQSTLYTRIKEWNPAVKELNIQLQRFCKKLGLEYLDLNTQLSSQGELRASFTDDGMHLNFEGYLVWSEAIRSLIHRQPKKGEDA